MMTYCLLISLEKDSARRDALFEQSFFDGNLPVQIFGVDGRAMFASRYFALGVEKHSVPLSPAEVGCSLSHIEALRHFLASDKDTALVIEDDVLGLTTENRPLIDALLQLVDSNEVILLGGLDGLSCKYDIMGKADDRLNGLWQVPRSMHHWAWRSCCYVIGREAAQRIVDLQTAWMDKADNWKKFAAKADIRISYLPIVCHPIDNASNIEDSRSASFARRKYVKLLRRCLKKAYCLFWRMCGLRFIHEKNL